MLVVLVVLGLVLGLVLARAPRIGSRVRLARVAGRITGVLRLARAEAIAADRSVTVVVDPVRRTVRIVGAPPWRVPAGVAIAPGPQGGAVAVTFAPDGTAAGGPVVLSAAESHRVIVAGWLTGRVETEDVAAEQ
jgi:general secretion pathway protein H